MHQDRYHQGWYFKVDGLPPGNGPGAFVMPDATRREASRATGSGTHTHPRHRTRRAAACACFHLLVLAHVSCRRRCVCAHACLLLRVRVPVCHTLAAHACFNCPADCWHTGWRAGRPACVLCAMRGPRATACACRPRPHVSQGGRAVCRHARLGSSRAHWETIITALVIACLAASAAACALLPGGLTSITMWRLPASRFVPRPSFQHCAICSQRTQLWWPDRLLALPAAPQQSVLLSNTQGQAAEQLGGTMRALVTCLLLLALAAAASAARLQKAQERPLNSPAAGACVRLGPGRCCCTPGGGCP
jgi:hypothetical protein